MEEVLYESGDIRITPARVVLGAATYAVANITSVRAVTDTIRRSIGVAIALVALGVIALVLTDKLAWDWVPTVEYGGFAIFLAVLLVVFGVEHQVVVTTGARESVAFKSRNKPLALEIASAINLAIMKRAETLGR
ncbi:MAG: hypothetical protein KC636_10055 [Myxococcales bacterium]|nr:hypothetical protein [Myxococcales bacterium]